MGETACLIPFSNSSDISHQDSEEDPAPVSGGSTSISFGRFATDSLAWEKWSSFSHNRYLEEVERYKNPGSVAQKKAYFEAHYKRIAAQRAAELLEQANAAASIAPDSNGSDSTFYGAEPELDDGTTNGNIVQQFGSSDCGKNHTDQSHVVDSSNQFAESDNYVPVDKPEEFEGSVVDLNFSIETSEYVSDEKPDDLERKMAEDAVLVREEKIPKEFASHEKPDDSETKVVEETVSVSEGKIPMEYQTQIDPLQQLGDIENHSRVIELDSNKINQAGKPPLKESSAANQEISGGTKNPTVVSASKSSNVCRNPKLPPASPAKLAAPTYAKKENVATPNSRRSPWNSVDKKRSTPNSLHMSLNFAPTRSGEIVPSKTNRRALVLEKIGGSKTPTHLSKPSREFSKSPIPPIKSPNPPTKISFNGANIRDATASGLEKRRKTPLPENSIARSQRTDRKWFSLSVDPSRSSSSSGIKAGSRILSCFNLRSEERATMRKEFFMKLEEKANAKEAEKEQLQAKSKEEAKVELKKMRQTLGFKAKPMPDFYTEAEPTKNQSKKIPLTRPRSPKLGRKINHSPVQGANSLPPRPPVKSDGPKNNEQKKNRKPDHSHAPFLNKKTH